MIWIACAVGGLVALVAVATAIGATFPKDHRFSGSVRLASPPEAVWAVITDFAAQPGWSPLVRAVERLPDRDGREVWREISRQGPPMTLETLESDRPRRLVRSIADEKQAFSGRWTFTLAEADGGTTLDLTEDGTVPNPFFRFMVNVMGPGKYVRTYLDALRRRVG